MHALNILKQFMLNLVHSRIVVLYFHKKEMVWGTNFYVLKMLDELIIKGIHTDIYIDLCFIVYYTLSYITMTNNIHQVEYVYVVKGKMDLR